MSSGELLVTLIVAFIVFGPKKLPMLAEHLGQLMRCLNHFKQQAMTFWQTQLQEQQLRENTHKAQQADAIYQSEVDILPVLKDEDSFNKESRTSNPSSALRAPSPRLRGEGERED